MRNAPILLLTTLHEHLQQHPDTALLRLPPNAAIFGLKRKIEYKEPAVECTPTARTDLKWPQYLYQTKSVTCDRSAAATSILDIYPFTKDPTAITFGPCFGCFSYGRSDCTLQTQVLRAGGERVDDSIHVNEISDPRRARRGRLPIKHTGTKRHAKDGAAPTISSMDGASPLDQDEISNSEPKSKVRKIRGEFEKNPVNLDRPATPSSSTVPTATAASAGDPIIPEVAPSESAISPVLPTQDLEAVTTSTRSLPHVIEPDGISSIDSVTIPPDPHLPYPTTHHVKTPQSSRREHCFSSTNMSPKPVTSITDIESQLVTSASPSAANLVRKQIQGLLLPAVQTVMLEIDTQETQTWAILDARTRELCRSQGDLQILKDERRKQSAEIRLLRSEADALRRRNQDADSLRMDLRDILREARSIDMARKSDGGRDGAKGDLESEGIDEMDDFDLVLGLKKEINRGRLK